MSQTKLFIVSVLLLGLSSQAWALRSDRQQPIDIKANRVEVDQRQQVSHYIGNVRMEQGSLKITADEVVVYMVKGQVHKIVITGNPARFEQQPENNREVVTSQADNMEYYAGEERLLLKHHAQVNQGGNLFRGDFIEYDTLTSTVKANKAEDSQSRVHAIIQPAKPQEETPPGPAQQDKTGQPAPTTGKP